MAFATVNYHSLSLKKGCSLSVIFPDDPPLRRPWAVLYLLHGASDDHTSWMRWTSIERYVHGWPLVVVMPGGDLGWYTNALEGGAYEDALVKDVVALIDRTFQVKAERAGRAIGGMSMGGYGAIKLGLKHPDQFCSITSHSGALAVVHSMSSKSNELGPELKRIFGPKPTGGADDLFDLAQKVPRDRVPALRFDCGTEDQLLEENRAFHKHLDSMHIAHEYKEYPGGHVWSYWDIHVREAIAFHAKNLGLKFDDRG